MPSSFPAWGDVPTWGLLVGAAITAGYAIRAFGKQADALKTLKKQADDGKTLIGQQAELIKIQSDQLAEQRKVTEKQIGVLELQGKELEASLAERVRDAENLRRGQANTVAAWFDEQPGGRLYAEGGPWGAMIRNASNLPILDVGAAFYLVDARSGVPSKPIYRGEVSERVLVIPPGAERFVPIPENILTKHNEVGPEIYVVGIKFTDAAGNHWERDPRGALTDC